MTDTLQRLRYPELGPEGIARLSALEHHLNAESGLDPVLLELVRLLVSQKNGCEFCIALHSSELRRHHEPDTRINAVTHWRDSDAFTHRERAALRWAEVITDIQNGHAPDAEFNAIREHFADAPLVELTLAIATINAWNRMAIAFHPQWKKGKAAPPSVAVACPVEPLQQQASAPGDDQGKLSSNPAEPQ